MNTGQGRRYISKSKYGATELRPDGPVVDEDTESAVGGGEVEGGLEDDRIATRDDFDDISVQYVLQGIIKLHNEEFSSEGHCGNSALRVQRCFAGLPH